jgi:hypothetical protein
MLAIMQALATPCSALPKDPSALAASISACQSSISALESSLNTTAGSSGGWEAFAWFCSVAVGIGVAAEIVGIVWEYRDDLKDWRRGIIRPPDRPSFIRFFWFEVLATVVVVAGIFGEASSSKELANINSLLRSKTSELRVDTDGMLSLVTQESGNAVREISEVQKKADAISQREDVLNGQVDATASKEGELNTLVRSQLPRRLLLDEGKTNFISALKPFARQRVIVTSCGNLSPQSERSKMEQGLITLLGSQGASWDVSAVAWDECLNTRTAGITVNFTDSSPDAVRAGTALVNVLNQLNIMTTAYAFYQGVRPIGTPPIGFPPPFGLLRQEPNTIVVMVGIHTMASGQ